MRALAMVDSEYHPVVTATRGVVFLATPFRGTSFQDVAGWAQPGLGILAVMRRQKVTILLESVKGLTFDLGELVRSFTLLQREHDYLISTFYEMGFTNLYEKVPLLGSFLSFSLSKER